jgi:hypothetical protein
LLKLRRGRVVSVEAGTGDARLSRLSVRIDGEASTRPAIAYPPLTGPVEEGDEVVVNVEARDLGLGSGGFDIVCVNLTRGLAGEGEEGARVTKLNYTPLQHAVRPVEEGLEQSPPLSGPPAAVIPLHGYLVPAAYAFSTCAPGRSLGYVQSAGGALPGWLSNDVEELLARGLISDHVTAGPCFGGRREAITVEGALHAAVARLGWDAAVVGPGPGILGSASTLGHGGLAALHNAHAALALGSRPVVAPRLSSGDPRSRHRGLSHHTHTVLSLLLEPCDVALPDRLAPEVSADLERSAAAGHVLVECSVDDLVEPYLESGLPATTMGRTFHEDEDFFRAALAAGAALAAKIRVA